MRRTAFLLAGLWVTLSGCLAAQTITGTWQGSLPVAQAPRLVVRIAGKPGALTASFARIDRDPAPVPFLAVTFTQPDLTLAVGDVTYRGKLSPDGNSIVGSWTQNKQTDPLTLVLATPETTWKPAPPAALAPMAANADPSFEVATVKPSRPDADNWGYSTRTRHFQARDNTVADLILFAYTLRSRQVVGGPGWMREQRFDIAAEPDAPGQPSIDQQRLMVRKLLAARFGLRMHNEEKDFPVYLLTVAASHPEVRPSDPAAHGSSSVYVLAQPGGSTAVRFGYAPMQDFADILMNFIPERQILDRTGLSGQWDFTLSLPTTVLNGADAMEKATAFLAAVQPLGFKLTPAHAPLPVLVVDHLETPTPN